MCFACMYDCGVPSAHGSQMKMLEPLVLGLWVVVRHYIGARNQAQVL